MAKDPEPLPLLPGFREIALRRMSGERRRLLADLTARRQAAGLSQTEIAARMRTSQSAVARLEAGDADVRMSTLERYAAAIGSSIAWEVRPNSETPEEPDERSSRQHHPSHPAVAAVAAGIPVATGAPRNARSPVARTASAGPGPAVTGVD
jgi:transcriptional regulator with XRE-family HTH domain